MPRFDAEAPSYLVDVTEGELRSGLLAGIQTGDDKSVGSWLWEVVVPIARQLWRVGVQNVRVTLAQSFISSAFGSGLDDHGPWLDRKRLGALPSRVTLHFYNSVPGTTIPRHYQAATPAAGGGAAVLFEVAEDGALVGPGGVADVLAEALTGGSATNVGAGSVVVLPVARSGLAAVTNLAPATGGTDVENDDLYRDGLLSAARAVRGGGSEDDLVSWTRAVVGQTAEVRVFPRWDGDPGKERGLVYGYVTVAFLLPGGLVPEQADVDAVVAAIDPADGSGRLGANDFLVVVIPTERELVLGVPGLVLDLSVGTEVAIKAALEDAARLALEAVPIGGSTDIHAVERAVGETAGVVSFGDVTLDGTRAPIVLGTLDKARLGAVSYG